jgi:hypothetical protein
LSFEASNGAIMAKHSKRQTQVELVPDAWPRFEKFITEIMKVGPQHRSANAPKSAAPKAASAQSKKPRKKRAAT